MYNQIPVPELDMFKRVCFAYFQMDDKGDEELLLNVKTYLEFFCCFFFCSPTVPNDPLWVSPGFIHFSIKIHEAPV